jgi:CheY-like chemotaxis protein/anti-sigma regulatory factor (Ser/Thr protein kinase)
VLFRSVLDADLAGRKLLGDPLRLGQVLINLLSNAIKFSGHGEVRLSIRVIEEDQDEVVLRFEVHDEGIGISPDDQKRLFIAFEQADGSMARRYGGTGLGLAISKRLAEMMGGEIGMKSAPGSGSVFWFTARLRLDEGSSLPPHALSEPASAEQRLRQEFAGSRILLAEDEPISCEVIGTLLADAGLQLDIAADGEQAVTLARRNRYDLILMDVQMPVMSGLDATREIRAASLNRATPIMAITANALEHDRQLCRSAGMDDHLGKPVMPATLFEAVLGWLELAR